MNVHNQNLILRCDSDTCDFIVMDPSELEFHRKTHHPAPGECRLCTFIALNLSELADHYENSHPTANVGARDKEHRHTNPTDQPHLMGNRQEGHKENHMRCNMELQALQINGRSRDLWTCVICGLAARSLTQVASHVQDIHGAISTFMCYFCNTVFHLENDLQQHLELNHYHRKRQAQGSLRRRDPVRCYRCDMGG